MGHTTSDRRERAREKELLGAQIAEAKRVAQEEIEYAKAVVTAWNERVQQGRRCSFFPTVETCVIAETPWLQTLCPGCRTIGEVDLRAVDNHHGASIETLIPRLSCRMCRADAPFAQLVGLTAEPQTPRFQSESFEAMARAKRERR
jgi:hypothetical protein